MVVVDTDVIIWMLRGDKETEERFKATVINSNGYIFITPIQIAEIYSGIRPKERLRVENFMESLNVIAIDRDIGKRVGEYLNKYRKSHNVTMADALIGASAKVNTFKLWTLNKKHYPMLTDREFFE